MKNRIITKNNICKFILYFLCFLVFSNAKINSFYMPFATAFLFVCLFFDLKIQLYIPAFFISYVIINFNYVGLIVGLNSISVVVFLFLLFKLINKKIKLWHMMPSYIISQCGYVFFNIYTSMKIIESICYIIIGLVFIYISCVFIKALKQKKEQEFLLDERICKLLFFISLSIGCIGIKIFNIDFSWLFLLLIFISVFLIKGRDSLLVITIIVVIGMLIKNEGFNSVSYYIILGAILYFINVKNKYAVLLAVLITKLLFYILFEYQTNISIFDFIPEMIMAAILLITPQKHIEKIIKKYKNNEKYIDEYLLNYEKNSLKQKLKYISEIFIKMQDYYKKMTLGEFNYDEVKYILADELYLKTCGNCEKCNYCTKQNKNLREAFAELIYTGLIKKKLTVVDLPLSIATCGKPATLLSETMGQIESFFQYESMMKKEDSSKLLIGNQLNGAGNLLNNLSNNINSEKRVNHNFELKIEQNLRYFDVFIKEIAIYEKDNCFHKCLILINKNSKISIIEDELSKIYKCKIRCFEKRQSFYPDYLIITLMVAPQFDLLIGKNTETKTGSLSSGDKYSFLPLPNNKMMIALSDGRGSGDMADNISEYTLSLIESFYKAGFENIDIITAVNKLMSFSSTEQFSALDVCIVNLNNGSMDIIKMGSSPTVIKSNLECEVLESENLPVGIISEVKPIIVRKYLSPGDVVILSTDGVYDSFSSQSDYLDAINCQKLVNMTMISENLIEEATMCTGGTHIDDKTVIAFKLMIKS